MSKNINSNQQGCSYQIWSNMYHIVWYPTTTLVQYHPEIHTLSWWKQHPFLPSCSIYTSHWRLLRRHIPNVNALVGRGHLKVNIPMPGMCCRNLGGPTWLRLVYLSVEPIVKQTTANIKIQQISEHDFDIFLFSVEKTHFTNPGVGTSSKSPGCLTKTVPERTALDSPKSIRFFAPRNGWRNTQTTQHNANAMAQLEIYMKVSVISNKRNTNQSNST